ncbi:MAG TPA: methyltransferase domain-containing protein [Lacipirellulaceae bacterium]|nr:methyltransferase domain-containing protein [Lacipirellulaceae bacterium]
MNQIQQQAGTFFDRFAETFDTFYDGKRSVMMQWFDRRWRRDMFVRYSMTFERLGDLKGKRGLDIGCGSGPYVAEAIKRGASQVVGLDPAPGMLELTRMRIEKLGALDKIQLVEGFFPNKLPEGPFDFAIIMGVLDYVPDPVEFFRGLRTILAGKACVSFPSRHWFRTPVRKVRYRLRNCPVYFYDEAQIRKIGREAGFGTVDVMKIEGAGMDYHVCLAP